MLVDQIKIEDLSIADRIQLVTDIWDTISDTPENLPLTQAKMACLDERLDAFQQHSSEGRSWSDIKQNLE